VLVIPDVKKVGFIIAGQWGTGALQVGGRTVDYCTMTAGSAGFQAGYQEADFVFVFFTQDAVAGFAFGREGVMGGWSAKGTRFERVTLD
jgi:lipid-binding SYLF domain-containing protein